MLKLLMRLRQLQWVPIPRKLPHTNIDNPWEEDVRLQSTDKHLGGKLRARTHADKIVRYRVTVRGTSAWRVPADPHESRKTLDL